MCTLLFQTSRFVKVTVRDSSYLFFLHFNESAKLEFRFLQPILKLAHATSWSPPPVRQFQPAAAAEAASAIVILAKALVSISSNIIFCKSHGAQDYIEPLRPLISTNFCKTLATLTKEWFDRIRKLTLSKVCHVEFLRPAFEFGSRTF